jgi:hypothetical protein
MPSAPTLYASAALPANIPARVFYPFTWDTSKLLPDFRTTWKVEATGNVTYEDLMVRTKAYSYSSDPIPRTLLVEPVAPPSLHAHVKTTDVRVRRLKWTAPCRKDHMNNPVPPVHYLCVDDHCWMITEGDYRDLDTWVLPKAALLERVKAAPGCYTGDYALTLPLMTFLFGGTITMDHGEVRYDYPHVHQKKKPGDSHKAQKKDTMAYRAKLGDLKAEERDAGGEEYEVADPRMFEFFSNLTFRQKIAQWAVDNIAQCSSAPVPESTPAGTFDPNAVFKAAKASVAKPKKFVPVTLD